MPCPSKQIFNTLFNSVFVSFHIWNWILVSLETRDREPIVDGCSQVVNPSALDAETLFRSVEFCSVQRRSCSQDNRADYGLLPSPLWFNIRASLHCNGQLQWVVLTVAWISMNVQQFKFMYGWWCFFSMWLYYIQSNSFELVRFWYTNRHNDCVSIADSTAQITAITWISVWVFHRIQLNSSH